MKKIFKIIIIILFTAFSFYYTDKIIDLSKSKDPIMNEIKNAKKTNETNPVNGIISKNTILIGVSGKQIDIDSSYEKMKKINKYNENLLEYISIKPSISKEKNYDKLITGVNTNNKELGIVFTTDNINYIYQINYILGSTKATFFIDGKVIESNLNDLKKHFKNNITIGLYSYNNIFDNTGINYIKNIFDINYSNYCLYKNEYFLNVCKHLKVNTIKPTIIERDLYHYIKNSNKNGFIYEIKVTKENIKELNSSLIYLKQKGYKIKSLDDLLKE